MYCLRGVRNSKNLRTPPKKTQKNHKKYQKITKKIKEKQKISKNLFKFNMREIVKIKKIFKKKSESSKFWGKNQKIFVPPGPSCEPLDCLIILKLYSNNSWLLLYNILKCRIQEVSYYSHHANVWIQLLCLASFQFNSCVLFPLWRERVIKKYTVRHGCSIREIEAIIQVINEAKTCLIYSLVQISLPLKLIQ